jgi:hypothetical protein
MPAVPRHRRSSGHTGNLLPVQGHIRATSSNQAVKPQAPYGTFRSSDRGNCPRITLGRVDVIGGRGRSRWSRRSRRLGSASRPRPVPTRDAPSSEHTQPAKAEGAPKQEGTRCPRGPSEANRGIRAAGVPARHCLYPALGGRAQVSAAATDGWSGFGKGPGRAVVGPHPYAHRRSDRGAYAAGSAKSDADATAN